MDNFKPLFNGTEMSVEELVQYRANTEYKLSHKEKVNRILRFIKENKISQEEMKIFNKILGDHKILDKLVFVWDGSYRSNIIFYKKLMIGKENNFVIRNYWLYGSNNGKYKTMSVMDNLNYIKNNYETLFIHLISDEESTRDRFRMSLHIGGSDYDAWSDPLGWNKKTEENSYHDLDYNEESDPNDYAESPEDLCL